MKYIVRIYECCFYQRKFIGYVSKYSGLTQSRSKAHRFGTLDDAMHEAGWCSDYYEVLSTESNIPVAISGNVV